MERTSPRDTAPPHLPWQRAFYIPLTILAWLALLVVVGWLLGYLANTIVLLVLAAVIAFACTPLTNLFHHWLPRPISIALAYLVGVAVIVGVGVFVFETAASQIASLVASIPSYATQAQSLSPDLVGLLAPFGVTQEMITTGQTQLFAQVQAIGSSIAKGAFSGIETAAGAVVELVLVFILSIYFAANGPRIADWLRSETPSAVQPRTRLLVAVINRVIGGYVRGVLSLASLVGIFVGVGMGVIGVPYPVLLGVLAFFMEFIPVLGVLLSGLASLLITLIRFHDVFHVVLVLAYFALVHVLEGDVVGPRIMGRAVGIHPATGLIALLVGTELFGVWGALFAAPLAGLVQATIIAAWLEAQGGSPQSVLMAVTQTEEGKAEEQASEDVQADEAAHPPRPDGRAAETGGAA